MTSIWIAVLALIRSVIAAVSIGRVGAHPEVLDPAHPGAVPSALVDPLDVHELERSRLDPARDHPPAGPVGRALGDPAPHLAVLVGVHGQAEPHGVAVAVEDLGATRTR